MLKCHRTAEKSALYKRIITCWISDFAADLKEKKELKIKNVMWKGKISPQNAK